MSLQVHPGASESQCLELGKVMSDEDRRECLATRPGVSLEAIIQESVAVSSRTWSIVDETGCIGIFGVRDYLGRGVPWLLSSDRLLEVHQKEFIRLSLEYSPIVTEGFPCCYNLVSASNSQAHRWLTWLGFTVDKGYVHHHNGVDFYPFTKESTCVIR